MQFKGYCTHSHHITSLTRKVTQKQITALGMQCSYLGTGMFIAFYGQEWYARKRCAPYSNAFVDIVMPRHWMCQRAHWPLSRSQHIEQTTTTPALTIASYRSLSVSFMSSRNDKEVRDKASLHTVVAKSDDWQPMFEQKEEKNPLKDLL